MRPRRRVRRSTSPGGHRPVLLDQILAGLDPRPGEILVDCTLGLAGHAVELLRRVGPTGHLYGFDLDAGNLGPAAEKLASVSSGFSIHQGNFAGFPTVLAAAGIDGCDVLLADLGMSSMQVDDPDRGFSFMRDGPLDMRMDRARGRTAAELLNTLPAADLASAFRDLGDEPAADTIAAAIVQRRSTRPLERTRELTDLVLDVAPPILNPHPRKGEPTLRQQQLRPVSRVFQALRILVNRELANVQELLRVLPWTLRPGGRAAIISFHSGEDRLVKSSFREGHRSGLYDLISEEPIRPSFGERLDNPRSRSAKLRWARRTADAP